MKNTFILFCISIVIGLCLAGCSDSTKKDEPELPDDRELSTETQELWKGLEGTFVGTYTFPNEPMNNFTIEMIFWPYKTPKKLNSINDGRYSYGKCYIRLKVLDFVEQNQVRPYENEYCLDFAPTILWAGDGWPFPSTHQEIQMLDNDSFMLFDYGNKKVDPNLNYIIFNRVDNKEQQKR